MGLGCEEGEEKLRVVVAVVRGAWDQHRSSFLCRALLPHGNGSRRCSVRSEKVRDECEPMGARMRDHMAMTMNAIICASALHINIKRAHANMCGRVQPKGYATRCCCWVLVFLMANAKKK